MVSSFQILLIFVISLVTNIRRIIQLYLWQNRWVSYNLCRRWTLISEKESLRNNSRKEMRLPEIELQQFYHYYIIYKKHVKYEKKIKPFTSFQRIILTLLSAQAYLNFCSSLSEGVRHLRMGSTYIWGQATRGLSLFDLCTFSVSALYSLRASQKRLSSLLKTAEVCLCSWNFVSIRFILQEIISWFRWQGLG